MDINLNKYKNNFDVLPNGEKFSFWEDKTIYSKTYYVDNNCINASDNNIGSKQAPFKTINRAAQVVKAGEKVVINGGIYRETVSEITGGNSPSEMVCFEAADNREVIITGAEDWKGPFEKSKGYRETASLGEPELFSLDETVYYSKNIKAKVFMGKIDPKFFIGYNPFSVMNSPNVGFVPCEESRPFLASPPYGQDRLEYTPLLKKRGLMLCDGQIMEQVVRPYDLWNESQASKNIYWIAEGGLEIHFRLKNDDLPENHHLELAVREQGLSPERPGMAFIHIKGIKFQNFSNPFIPPQKGAVSTFCGHHWIIENCCINNCNTIGIDIGFQSHFAAHEGLRGYHIIRGNKITNCGINGICGLPTRGKPLENVLIEHNYFKGNCWHNAELLWESATIKNHFTKNCLYRFNTILDTNYGPGIWLDKCNSNSRICCNLFNGCKSTMYGMIFLEASFVPNLVDHNFVANVHKIYYPRIDMYEGGNGIYQHEVDNMIVANNIIINTEGYGVFMLYTKVTRVLQGNRGVFNCGNVILQNVMHNCYAAISLPTEKNFSDCNIFGKFTSGLFDFNIQNVQEKHSIDTISLIYGFEKNSCYAKTISLDINNDTQIATIYLDANNNKLKTNLDISKTDNLITFLLQIDKLFNSVPESLIKCMYL